MDMMVDFPGGARVDAHFASFTLKTDQPPEGGGEGSAPTPFDTFLASLGTCAGIFVLGFCRQRGIDTRGIRLEQRAVYDPTTDLVRTVHLDIQLPPSFPEKYKAAVIRAAEHCKVKRTLEQPPAFDVRTSQNESAAA
ncbi:MAG: OsmC family protein [Anaerolineales bacterium]|jgi:ribosomal protein S12 methylthiotransferase accessory factor